MEARDLTRAYRASLEAGDAAFEARAFAESQKQFERALELWDVASGAAAREGGDMDLVELRRLTGRAAYLAGDFERAAAHLRSAVDAVDASATPVRAGLLTERLGRALWAGGQLDPSMREYARAVELVPDDPPSADRARVLAGYGQILMLAGRYSESLPVAEQARAMAAAVGARGIEGHAATTVGTDIALLGDPDRGVKFVRDGLAISIEVGDLDDIGRGHANLASVLEIAGHLDESIDLSLAGMRAMRQAGLGGTYGSFNQLNAATGLYELGRWDEALAHALEAERGVFGVAEIFAHQVVAQLRAGRGEFDEARRRAGLARELIGSSTDAQFNGPLGLTVLEIAVWTGDLEGGRRAADSILAMIRDTEDDRVEAELLTWVLRIEADIAERSRAARASADTAAAVDRAAELLARLDVLAGRAGAGTYAELLETARAQGAAEAGRARGQSDAAAWLLAADVLKRRGRVYRAAYATYRAAEALATDRRNRAAAGALLAEARPVAVRLGAEPLRQVIDELAARARLTVEAAVTATSPAPSASGMPGFDLTRRELEVLALLAAGRTNRQIAQQLYISESTAGVHVSNILGKLGVDGRVEAAAMAVRLGLAG
jgi:DNA-binding CsgD family transcriptional regulator/tetratricopeptide (TPR) repeat protein